MVKYNTLVRSLCPLRRKAKKRVLYACDTETDNKGNFILAYLIGNDREIFCDSQDLFRQAINGLPDDSILCTFNLNYDAPYIANVWELQHDKIVRHHGRLLCIRLSNVEVIDLTNHVDGSLEHWIKELNMPDIYKLPLSQLRERCLNDTKATLYLGNFLQDYYFDNCDISIPLTKSSAAMRYYRRKFIKNRIWLRFDDEIETSNERESYHGGRTECFRRGYFQEVYSFALA